MNSTPSAKKKRIAVNALHAKSGGGVTYLCSILRHFAEDPELEFHLILHEEQLPLFDPLPAGIHLHLFDFRSSFSGLLMWEQTALPFLTRLMSADATFSPANYGPIFAPRPVILLRNALSVVGGEKRVFKRIYWIGLALMTLLSLLSCRKAIAVSEFARRQLTFGIDRLLGKKTAIVYHGISDAFLKARDDEPRQKFILAVSDIYVQKNLHTLIDALPIVSKTFPDLRLKIAGRPIDFEYFKSIEERAKRHGVRDQIDFLGHCPLEELAGLYSRCGVFVFPSTVETFGNPLVEAMACGAPVASSNSAAMPEIVDDAALFFDPREPEEIASCIVELLQNPDLADELSRRGVARARHFSWGVAARQTCDVLRETTGLGRAV